MPTENRSSNTEMVSVLQREDRYIVIKRSDLERISAQHRFEFSKASRVVHERMFAAGAPARRFLVIESDWPEYGPAWASIEARVTGKPAQHQGEPYGWAHDDGKEFTTHADYASDLEKEGIAMTPLYTRPAPAVQQEPVAYRQRFIWPEEGPSSWVLTESNILAGRPGWEVVPLYTHADPAEVERLRAELEQFKIANARLSMSNVDRRNQNAELSAQLAERDAMLNEASEWIKQNSFHGTDAVELWERIDLTIGSQS